MSSEDHALRETLLELLRGGSAHADATTALKDFPPVLYGKKTSGSPHTPWQLLEHLRIAQQDILDFCTNSEYRAPKWPDDYWPRAGEPKSEAEWEASVDSFLAGLQETVKLIENPSTNLYAQIPWGEGQTILREILLIADHNSYHLGQFVLLRKELGAWEG